MIFKFGDTPVLCRYRDKLHVGNIIRVSLLSKKIFFPDQGLFHPIILPLSPLSIFPPFRPPLSLFPPPSLIFFVEIIRIFLRIFPGKNIHPRLRTHTKKIVRTFLRPHACAVATFRKGVRAIQLVGRASESLFLHLSFLSLWIDVFPSHISLSINLNPFPVYYTSLCFPFIFSPPCNPHFCFLFFRYVEIAVVHLMAKKLMLQPQIWLVEQESANAPYGCPIYFIPVLFLPLPPPHSSPSPPFLLVK